MELTRILRESRSRRSTGATVALVISFALTACGGGGGGGGGSSTPPPISLQVFLLSIPNGTTSVDLLSTVRVSFNTLIDDGGVNSGNVQLSDGDRLVPINVVVSHDTAVIVTPTSPLKTNTTYTLTVKAGAKADNGTLLAADYSSTFKTSSLGFLSSNLVPPDLVHVTALATPIAVADINGDGRLDLVQLGGLPASNVPGVPPQGYHLSIFVQNDQGRFDSLQVIDYVVRGVTVDEIQCAKVFFLDIDNDGVPEIIVPEYFVNTALSGLRIFKKGLDGKFAPSGFLPTPDVQTLDLLDVDGDGRLDLVGSISYPYAAMQIFINGGVGLVVTPEVILPDGQYEFGLMDVRHDGKRELLANRLNYSAFNKQTELLVYWQAAPGVFAQDVVSTQTLSGVCAEFQSCRSMAVIDIDNDGWQDLVFGIVQPNIASVAYLRVPTAGFSLGFQTSFGIGVPVLNVVDFDKDGVLDLTITDGNGSTNFSAIAFGNGTATFTYSPAFPSGVFDAIKAGEVVVADVDGDGRLDFIFNSQNNGVTLLRQLP